MYLISLFLIYNMYRSYKNIVFLKKRFPSLSFGVKLHLRKWHKYTENLLFKKYLSSLTTLFYFAKKLKPHHILTHHVSKFNFHSTFTIYFSFNYVNSVNSIKIECIILNNYLHAYLCKEKIIYICFQIVQMWNYFNLKWMLRLGFSKIF